MSSYTRVICPVCLAHINEPCHNPSKDQLAHGLPPDTKWTGSIRKRVHESRVDEYEYCLTTLSDIFGD